MVPTLMARSCDDTVQTLRNRFGDEALLVEKQMAKIVDPQLVRSAADMTALRRPYDELRVHAGGQKAPNPSEESSTRGNGTDLQQTAVSG